MRTTLIVVTTVGMFAAPAFAQSKGAQGTKDGALVCRQVQSLLKAVVTARSTKLPVAPPRAHP